MPTEEPPTQPTFDIQSEDAPVKPWWETPPKKVGSPFGRWKVKQAHEDGIPTFAKLFALAKARYALNNYQLAEICGIPTVLGNPSTNIIRLQHGCKLTRQRIQSFITLGRMCGLKDVEILVLYVREELPPEYSHLKPLIGATVSSRITLFPHSGRSARRLLGEVQDELRPKEQKMRNHPRGIARFHATKVAEPETIEKLLPKGNRFKRKNAMKGGPK